MTIQPNDTATNRLGQFFDLIWGDTNGVVYIPTKDATNKWIRTYFKWPENRSNAIQFVLLHTTSRDVYYSPAIYKPEVVDKILDAKKNKKDLHLGKEDILGSNVVWVEYDGNAPEEWTPAAGEAGSVEPRPAGAMPEPTLRVQSSGEGNQHIYWRLKEFNTDIEFIERVNRAVAYMTNADTSGWDINQVLRPIETVNRKYPGTPQVIVYSENRHEYPASEFSHFEPVKDLIKTSIDIDDLPDPLQVLAKYVWLDDDIALINKDKDEFGERDRSGALMRIGYTCAEMSLSDAEIYSLLLFCDDKWEKFKHRPNRERRLIEIINRARQKYPHGVTDPTFAGLLGQHTPVEVKPLQVYSFRELLQADIHVDWVIEDAIPKAGLGMIVSAPGRGKTQFTMQLAMACALNESLLYLKPDRPHRTMLFQLEMNAPSLKHFVNTMAGGYTEQQQEVLDRNFLLFPHGMPINLMHQESRKGFESLIEQYQPEGVYIDSLQKIYLGDLSKDEIRGIYTYLASVRQKYGVYIFLIHHDRKAQEGNKRPRDLSDVYGSVYITAEPDCVFHLWRAAPESKELELRNLKNRLAKEFPPYLIHRDQNLKFAGREIEFGNDGIEFNGLREGPDRGSSGPFLTLR